MVRLDGEPLGGRARQRRAPERPQSRRHRAHRRPQRPLVVPQGTTCQLRRFDSVDGSVSPVDSTSAGLVNADGLVRQGGTLTVVRNFSRMLSTLRLSADGRTATVLLQQATDRSRVLMTAARLDGRILFVDSRFDEPVANPPYEVVTDPMVR